MIVGMMRVKNEARWIQPAILSLLPVCDRILVMDDHSTDDTGAIAARVGHQVQAVASPFTGLDEVRDKNWMLEIAIGDFNADWILCIDGDEMLAPSSVPILRKAFLGGARCISMRIPYLWDNEDQIRVDGVYGEFRRHSAFQPAKHRYASTSANGFHCGNVPIASRSAVLTRDDIQLLHFGYMLPEDRARKYAWYNAVDPGNKHEDHYRHIAAGLTCRYVDLIGMQIEMREAAGLPELMVNQILPRPPGPDERTAHAGPLEVVPWQSR